MAGWNDYFLTWVICAQPLAPLVENIKQRLRCACCDKHCSRSCVEKECFRDFNASHRDIFQEEHGLFSRDVVCTPQSPIVFHLDSHDDLIESVGILLIRLVVAPVIAIRILEVLISARCRWTVQRRRTNG